MARRGIVSRTAERNLDRLAAGVPLRALCLRFGIDPDVEGPTGDEPDRSRLGLEAEVALLRRVILAIIAEKQLLQVLGARDLDRFPVAR